MYNMKKILFILPILFLFACGSEETEDGLPINIEITGTVKGLSEEEITLSAQSQQGTITVATATCDTEGKYHLKGNIPDFGIYSIQFGNDATNQMVIPLEINDKVIISGDRKTIALSPTISGTNWSKPLVNYMRYFAKFTQEQSSVFSSGMSEQEMLKKLISLKKPMEEYARLQSKKDPSNAVNIVLVSMLFPSKEEGIENWNKENLNSLKAIEKAYQTKYMNSPITGMLSQQIASIESGLNKTDVNNSGEIMAPEIALENPEGKILKLSDLRGKFVLIDFWASWCAPCRNESPNMVKMYSKFKNKGFEIFSVSLDQDPLAWKNAIAQDQLNWKYHVSDLKGWETPMQSLYGIEGIPYTVLVNKEGKIIATGLRGEILEQKLLEVMP